MTGPRKPIPEQISGAIDSGLAHIRRVDPDAAADLDTERRREAGHPRVVVVGETKRGKSSLINALVGVPGLSPVDANVATSAYLDFGYGQEPSARAYVPGNEIPVPLSIHDLRDWGTVLGRMPDDTRPPQRIDVTYPAPMLSAVGLVDTPGVGGLDSEHGDIALHAVDNATALLFVIDASAPFSKPELNFLTEASKRVNLVLFALTKTDAYPGWRTILDDDKALLHAHAPRFASAEFFPVSARLAEMSRQLPPEASAELQRESRITSLQAALQGAAARQDLLVQANLLRTVRSELIRLDQDAGDRMKAADPDPQTLQQLKEERASVSARKRSDARQWSITLSTEVRRARTDATARLRAQVTHLQEQFLNQLEKASGEAVKRLPYDVDRALHALSLRLSAELDHRFRQIGQIVLREVFTERELVHVLRGINARLRHGASQKIRRDNSGMDASMMVASTAGMSFMAGRGALAGAVGILGGGLFAPIAAVGVGVAAGAFLLWRRKVAQNRQQAKIWLKEVLAEARASLSDEVSHRFTDLEHILTMALDEAIERRIAQLDANIAEIDKTMLEEKETRQKRKSQLSSDRDAIRQRIRQLDEVLIRVREATKTDVESQATGTASVPARAAAAPGEGRHAAPSPGAPAGAHTGR
jgi:hypothetical protein